MLTANDKEKLPLQRRPRRAQHNIGSDYPTNHMASSPLIEFGEPFAIAFLLDSENDRDSLIVTDYICHRLRGVDLKARTDDDTARARQPLDCDSLTARNATERVFEFAGSGEPGIADGIYERSQFNQPLAICVVPATGATAGAAAAAAGGTALTKAGGASGTGSSGKHVSDANRNTAVLVTDHHSVRRIQNGIVVTVAGSGVSGYRDGIGTNAQFNGPRGVACTSDGQIAFVTDRCNNCLRRIDLKTGAVTTVALANLPRRKGANQKAKAKAALAAVDTIPAATSAAVVSALTGGTGNTAANLASAAAAQAAAAARRLEEERMPLCAPRFLVFDMNTRESDSVLFVTCVGGIRRVVLPIEGNALLRQLIEPTGLMDVLTHDVWLVVAAYCVTPGRVSTVKPPHPIDPWGIDVTPLGVLIVSCGLTHSLYSIDPDTGDSERVAGNGQRGFADGSALSAKFNWPRGLVVVDHDQCVYVCDNSIKEKPRALGQAIHHIRRISLPPYLFESPAGVRGTTHTAVLGGAQAPGVGALIPKSNQLVAAGQPAGGAVAAPAPAAVGTPIPGTNLLFIPWNAVSEDEKKAIYNATTPHGVATAASATIATAIAQHSDSGKAVAAITGPTTATPTAPLAITAPPNPNPAAASSGSGGTAAASSTATATATTTTSTATATATVPATAASTGTAATSTSGGKKNSKK